MTYASPQKVVLIGKETTWGTAVTPDKDVGIVTDIDDSLNREISEVLGLGSIETQQVNTGNVDVSGSFTFKFQHGRILEYVLGSVTHTETTGDPKHTFSITDEPPSFTLESSEDGTTDTARTYSGCLVENCEVSISNTGELTIKVDWKGKSVTSSATSTGATISSLITFPKSLVDVKLNGSSASEVQEASITITKKVERSWGVGSNLPQQGKATEMRFEFSAKLGFQDKTLQELGIGGTTPPNTSNPTGVEFEIQADNGVTLGSGRREFKLTLENCQFSKATVTASAGDMIFLELAGNGTFKECFAVDNISSTSW
jgi:hypothetical protein